MAIILLMPYTSAISSAGGSLCIDEYVSGMVYQVAAKCAEMAELSTVFLLCKLSRGKLMLTRQYINTKFYDLK